MKYFTAEIWAGWQGRGMTFEQACAKSDANTAVYRKSLRKLAPKLGKRAGSFFMDHSLHDGRLLSFAISDQPPDKLEWRPPQTRVSAVVLVNPIGSAQTLVYKLKYTGVKEISVQTRNNLFPSETSRFGDWGYDELLPAGRLHFCHNILFETGTEVSITFKKFQFEHCAATKKEIKRLMQS